MSLFDVPPEVLSARPPGAADFDFLQGRWLIQHKRLAERLVGCQTWHEFRTPAANQLILGGLGNIDHIRTESGDFYEGASLRLFDKRRGLWRIYWMDTNGALSFRRLKVLLQDQSECFADTTIIRASLFSSNFAGTNQTPKLQPGSRLSLLMTEIAGKLIGI